MNEELPVLDTLYELSESALKLMLIAVPMNEEQRLALQAALNVVEDISDSGCRSHLMRYIRHSHLFWGLSGQADG